MEIILSTRNISKAQQIKALLTDLPVEILTLTEANIPGVAIEDGETLQQNAYKKALFAYELAGVDPCTMADDTGLFINALKGFPGVRSARWAGPGISTEEIGRLILEKLHGKADRSAYFETVVALITPHGEKRYFSGRVDGVILEEPKCMPQPMMPYSHIFQPQGQDKVWAEMSVDEENLISHRGKAFRQVHDFLHELLSQ